MSVRLESGAGGLGPILGIDLGTTHSLCAIVKDGLPTVLESREGKRLLPSIVAFGETAGSETCEGEPVIGYAAKRRKAREPRGTLFSVKRLLGRSYADLEAHQDELPYELAPPSPEEGRDAPVRVRVGSRTLSAVEVSALILQELKRSAEAALGQPVRRAVVTVPAYFNDAQRQATRTAGRLAGLEVLRILNEPTAAALAYGLDRKREGIIAVYDLGGGTFDVSILKLHDGIFEVLATHGDTRLGGDDLDQVLVSLCAKEIQEREGSDPRRDAELNAILIEACERAKIQLSSADRVSLQIPLGEGKGVYEREITREEFETAARPLLERTRRPCEQALADAGLKRSDLSDVVLVGGPTRLSIVRQVAQEIFNREPNASMHPDEVVALGAAIQADILGGGNSELLLLDVVPLSLGIETYGGLMSVLIPRNTKIPCSARETFTTFVDHQTAVDIHVAQGEREQISENRSLARFKLRGIPPQPAGMPRVEVSFLVDADGILQVAARDLKTGVEQTVEVRPSFGLAEAEVQRLLAEGLSARAEDAEYRRLVEARNQAKPLIRGVEVRLGDARRLLSPAEVIQLETRLAELREVVEGTDVDRIRQAVFQLDRASASLADKVLTEALQTAAGPKSDPA